MVERYSDIVKNAIFPEAEKVDVRDILDKEIIIHNFQALPSSLAEGKEFVVVLAEVEGRYVSFNCGEIVLKQLRNVKELGKLDDKEGIIATIKKPLKKRYYSLF